MPNWTGPDRTGPRRLLPAAAPAGVGSPAPSSWQRRRQRAETAEEQISGQIIQQRSPERSEVKGQNLSSHGLHAGLQVSEQVEALVKEGELGVDEGEHLRNQVVNAAHKNNKTKFFIQNAAEMTHRVQDVDVLLGFKGVELEENQNQSSENLNVSSVPPSGPGRTCRQ